MLREVIDRPSLWDRLAIDSKPVSIVLLAACMVMTLSLWFSVSAVVPVLKQQYALGDGQAGLMASAVSVGFVVGTLVSAVLGLADRLHPRHFFMVSALAGAAANTLILAFEPTAPAVVVLRFLTGVAMAGIYPVGVKMVATWARGDTGFLVGLVVGALCLGSATPHLFSAFNGLDWQATLLLASAAAAAAGVLVNLAGLGPSLRAVPPFEPKYVAHAWRDRELLLTNLGYWGHKWENYAMWAWIGVFLQASFAQTLAGAAEAGFWAGLVTFVVIAAGGLGCVAGGLVADRVGRTMVLMVALVTSGACAILSGLVFDASPWLVSLVSPT